MIFAEQCLMNDEQNQKGDRSGYEPDTLRKSPTTLDGSQV